MSGSENFHNPVVLLRGGAPVDDEVGNPGAVVQKNPGVLRGVGAELPCGVGPPGGGINFLPAVDMVQSGDVLQGDFQAAVVEEGSVDVQNFLG